MISIGPVAGLWPGFGEGDDEPILIVAVDETRALCVNSKGRMEWIDLDAIVVTGWSFESSAGIWVTEGEALYQAAEQEEVSGEALD